MKIPYRILISGLSLIVSLKAQESGTTPPLSVQSAPPQHSASAPTGAAFNPAMRPPTGGPGAGGMGLTQEEGRLLGMARMQLQKDPEIVELNAQIKALMDKREKLSEEKLKASNPEAAALMAKLRERQEKMMADRKAQMDAMQAKMKAQQEAASATVAPSAQPPSTIDSKTPEAAPVK